MFYNRLLNLIVISFIIYGLLLFTMGLSEITLALNNIESMHLLLSFLIAFLGYLIRGERMHILMDCINTPVSRLDSQIYFFSGMTMILSPGKVGEFIKSHYIKKKYDYSISKTIPVVILERLYDFAALTALILSGFFVFGINLNLVFGGIFFFLCIIFIFLNESLCLKLISIFGRIKALSKYSDKAKQIYLSIVHTLTLKFFVGILFMSILAWGLECLCFFIIVESLELDLSIASCFYIFSLSLLVGNLSMIPGGIGASEISMSSLMIMQNISRSDAVAAAILVRLVTFWFAIFCGSIALKYAINNESYDIGLKDS